MDSLWPPHSGGNGRSGLQVRVLIEAKPRWRQSEWSWFGIRRVLPLIPILQLEDSRIAEPARGHEQLPGGSCRLGHCCLARSHLGRLLVETRPNQIVLRLFVPIPVVARSSATHSVLLEMEIGWRSAMKANRTVEVSAPHLRWRVVFRQRWKVGLPCTDKTQDSDSWTGRHVPGRLGTGSVEQRQNAARQRKSVSNPCAVTRTKTKTATGRCAREASGKQ